MKKLLCVMLAVILTTGIGPVNAAAAAVVTTGIKSINESASIGNLVSPSVTVNDGKDGTLSLSGLDGIEVSPGDVIKIPLSGKLFLDVNGNDFGNANVALSALNSASVGVRAAFNKGSGAYTVSLGGNRNGSYIQIQFDNGIYIKPQSFTSYIFLTKNGARKMATRINITGQLQTPVQELSSGDDYADISDGSAVKPKALLRNVELYLGDYCSITRTLSRGMTYVGTATADDYTEQDIIILNKYPAVEYIYKLRTVNLKTSGNIVTFDLGKGYYVYNSNGSYIGTSNQALPYWTRYYISSKKYDSLSVK